MRTQTKWTSSLSTLLAAGLGVAVLAIADHGFAQGAGPAAASRPEGRSGELVASARRMEQLVREEMSGPYGKWCCTRSVEVVAEQVRELEQDVAKYEAITKEADYGSEESIERANEAWRRAEQSHRTVLSARDAARADYDGPQEWATIFGGGFAAVLLIVVVAVVRSRSKRRAA